MGMRFQFWFYSHSLGDKISEEGVETAQSLTKTIYSFNVGITGPGLCAGFQFTVEPTSTIEDQSPLTATASPTASSTPSATSTPTRVILPTWTVPPTTRPPAQQPTNTPIPPTETKAPPTEAPTATDKPTEATEP